MQQTRESMNSGGAGPASGLQWIYCDSALLPGGWAQRVAISIDAGGEIIEVLTGDAAQSLTTPVLRLRGCLLPGMPNLHSHAHQRAMAGLTERAGNTDDSFWTWREVMYHFVGRLQPHQLQAVAAQAYLEMLESGYTAVAEFQYLHHDPQGKPYSQRAEMSLRVLAAAREVGIGISLLPVLYRYGGFGAQEPNPGQRRFLNDSDGFLEIHQQLDTALDRPGEQMLGIAPHSLRAVSEPLLGEVLSAVADKPRRPVHIHIAEQSAEVEGCLSWSGQPPVAWLLENFEVDAHWCLVHATHMQTAERTELAYSQAVAGLCPSTEANLGDGVFQLVPYLEAGGHLGIGSDSHVSISPVEELRWLEYSQRLQGQCRNALVMDGQSSGQLLYEAALAGGAQACGRALGRIAPGHRADFVVLNTDHPLLYGRSEETILDSWIFSGNASPVSEVFVAGRRQVSGGRHIGAKHINARYRSVVDELMEAADNE